jgi:hypothetical protein
LAGSPPQRPFGVSKQRSTNAARPVERDPDARTEIECKSNSPHLFRSFRTRFARNACHADVALSLRPGTALERKFVLCAVLSSPSAAARVCVLYGKTDSPWSNGIAGSPCRSRIGRTRCGRFGRRTVDGRTSTTASDSVRDAGAASGGGLDESGGPDLWGDRGIWTYAATLWSIIRLRPR